MGLFGIGTYKDRAAKQGERADKKLAKFNARQMKLRDSIDILRKKSEDKSSLSNFISGRSRKINMYDTLKRK